MRQDYLGFMRPFEKLLVLMTASPLAFTLFMVAITSVAIGAGYYMDSIGIGVIVWVLGIAFMSQIIIVD